MTTKSSTYCLQAHAFRHSNNLPVFVLTSVLGDEPYKLYTVYAEYQGLKVEGEGYSRREAEQHASSQILKLLNMPTKVYIAGDMLTKGSQMLREAEKKDIRALNLDIYNPMDNKDINDKAACDNEELAERIVTQDTEALFESDVIVIEPQPFAMGTMVELGQLKGMKDTAEHIQDIIYRNDWDETAPQETLKEILEFVDGLSSKKVYPHFEDIRRVEGLTETGDRRSLGINAYVYGVCLDLSEGKGFYSWDEILENLK